MRLFGFEITRAKALPAAVPMVPAYQGNGGWFTVGSTVQEPFAGAWQRNMVAASPQNVMGFSAVHACISMISDDISKMRLIVTRREGRIWEEVQGDTPITPVLEQPNRYQVRQQFLSQWLTSLLMMGNAYVLLQRDGNRVVTAMYVLDPRLVHPMVTPDGGVYYQLGGDTLAQVPQGVAAIPASEIIHDRYLTPWHPLVGVSPIYACGMTALQGIKIQANSSQFFENMSRPSGQLTAPGSISNEMAQRLKNQFEENYGGANIGRLMVTGDGLKYEPMSIPANDAQLVEQLRWTVEDVARCFHVPLHKLSTGQNPTFNNVGALNQDYYSQTLQARIEAVEALLDRGMAVPRDMGIELDTSSLLRMDPSTLATANEAGIRGGYLTPNEARQRENLPPVDGGDTPYLQQQQFSLAALASRDSKPNPTGSRKFTFTTDRDGNTHAEEVD